MSNNCFYSFWEPVGAMVPWCHSGAISRLKPEVWWVRSRTSKKFDCHRQVGRSLTSHTRDSGEKRGDMSSLTRTSNTWKPLGGQVHPGRGITCSSCGARASLFFSFGRSGEESRSWKALALAPWGEESPSQLSLVDWLASDDFTRPFVGSFDGVAPWHSNWMSLMNACTRR